MSLKELLFVFLAAALADNLALTQFLGAVPMLGFSASKKKRCMGFSVFGVMVLSSVINYPIRNALVAAGKVHFCAFVAVIVVLVVCLAVEMVLRDSGVSLGFYFPIVALNSAVLGCCLNATAAGLGFGAVFFSALGGGAGFMLAMALVGGVMDGINQKYVPSAFRGLPSYLLAASIISMVLFVF